MTARVLCALSLMLCAGVLRAQPADTMLTSFEELAVFDDARALASDPSGVLYVVDAGRNVIVCLGPDGKVLSTLGGPGAEDGQFDEPSDIDPTNGLVWIVADAGNGRLQRFSRTQLHLETIPVARIDRFTPGIADRRDPVAHDSQSAADGRPIAVATNSAGDIFAVDAAQGIVKKWDASRRLERAIGGYDAGRGALSEPVAVAADVRSLYVADRMRAEVVVYDVFGGVVRSVASGLAGEVRSVTLVDGALLVVLPKRILVYERGERLVHVIDVEMDESLVDVHVAGDTMFFLSATRLVSTVYETVNSP